MVLRRSSAGLTALVVIGLAPAAAGQSAPPLLQRIDRSHLCVTNGAVAAVPGGHLAIETPSSRAVVQAPATNAADQIAEIHFRYLGPSRDSKPLASGELRRQIGLKLQAQDTCNLVYAMWRIEPKAMVAVSVKQNAGLHTHQQCGAHGYVNFQPQDQSLLPILPGEAHTLRAELHGQNLTVTADSKVVWQGSLGSQIALPVGPPGFRTDNARFALDYFTDAAAGSRRPPQQRSVAQGWCALSEGD